MSGEAKVKAVVIGKHTRVERIGTEVHLVMECGTELRAADLFNACQAQLQTGEINVRMINVGKTGP